MLNKKNGYIYYEYHEKTEKEEISETAWKSVFRWLYAVVGVFFVFSLLWSLVFHIVSVDGYSMQPTLNDNDSIFVYTFNYAPSEGDIVVIGTDDKDMPLLIKRVIALENQTVDVDYEKGVVIVDGKPLEEKYISPMTKPLKNEISYPYTVPENCVFVMGDNRDESYDSRDKALSSVDEKHIIGKALFRFYPFSDMNIYE